MHRDGLDADTRQHIGNGGRLTRGRPLVSLALRLLVQHDRGKRRDAARAVALTVVPVQNFTG